MRSAVWAAICVFILKGSVDKVQFRVLSSTLVNCNLILCNRFAHGMFARCLHAVNSLAINSASDTFVDTSQKRVCVVILIAWRYPKLDFVAQLLPGGLHIFFRTTQEHIVNINDE